LKTKKDELSKGNDLHYFKQSDETRI